MEWDPDCVMDNMGTKGMFEKYNCYDERTFAATAFSDQTDEQRLFQKDDDKSCVKAVHRDITADDKIRQSSDCCRHDL